MQRRSWITGIVYAALFVAAAVLYVATLNADVQPADSGELQIVAITLGVAHPPGYPLYTMLAWLFAQLPIGTAFARVSLFSAITSACTLVAVCRTVQISGSRLLDGAVKIKVFSYVPLVSGLIAAITLGTSTTFWAQATTANIRSLTSFFCSLMVLTWAVVIARSKSGDTRSIANSLYLFALVLGLGVGHHVSLVFVGAVLGIYVLAIAFKARLSAQSYVIAALILLSTQLVWLYLPLRAMAGARFAPSSLTTLSGLLDHILARGFAGDMLAFATPEFLGDRLAALPTLFTFEFGLVVLVALAVGVVVCVIRRNRMVIVLALACVLHLFITITYRAPQTVEYALPAWVILCVLLGIVGSALIQTLVSRGYALKYPARIVTTAILAVCFALLVGGVLHDFLDRLSSFVVLANDKSTRTNAESVLRSAAPDGSILSQWHQATALWALQDVEGLRQDVVVEYVYPHGEQAYADTFAERAAEVVSQRVTYVTSVYEDAFSKHGLRTFPMVGMNAWRICVGDEDCSVTSGDTIAQFDQRIAVSSVHLFAPQVSVGQMLDFAVNWMATGVITDGDALTVRIKRSSDRLAANADLVLDPTVNRGVLQSRRARLGIPLDLPPGEYQVLLGAYQTDGKAFQSLRDQIGTEYVPVATIKIAATTQTPISSRPMSQRIFNGSVLVGVDYDTGIHDRLRVLTHWQLAPITATLIVQNAQGDNLTPAQILPASHHKERYISVVFDPPPTAGMQLQVTAFGANGVLVTDTITLPDVHRGERYVPYADQMVLIGSTTSLAGDVLKADLHWLSARPITSDYSVSVRLTGDAFYKTNDSIPVLGALPTLKWIRGSQVIDRHPFHLDGYTGALSGTVVVYDAFTQQQLPALDERYANGITFAVER
jgi:hypothetical protein